MSCGLWIENLLGNVLDPVEMVLSCGLVWELLLELSDPNEWLLFRFINGLLPLIDSPIRGLSDPNDRLLKIDFLVLAESLFLGLSDSHGRFFTKVCLLRGDSQGLGLSTPNDWLLFEVLDILLDLGDSLSLLRL